MNEKFSIGIVGNGITGKATAVELVERLGEQANITIYDNYQLSTTNRPLPPSHLGPIGLEVQSGNLWNSYEFGNSEGGLHCRVEDKHSELWLREFARQSNDEVSLPDRQIELYAHNIEGLNHYMTHPEYSQHISQQGNVRLFRTEKALQRAAEYVTRLEGLYQDAPIVLGGDEEITEFLPSLRALHPGDYAGAIYYPEDATGDSLKIQSIMNKKIAIGGIEVVSAKIVEARSSGSGANVLSRNNKSRRHDLVLLCGGIENEEIAGIDAEEYWLYPFIGRRLDLSPTDSMGFENMTVGLDDECFILRQASDNRIQVGGTVIIRDRELYRQKLWFDDFKKDVFVERVLSDRFRRTVTTTDLRYGIRAMTQDDLPYVANPHDQEAILIVNPTGHLGFLQAPALANWAANYAERILDAKKTKTVYDQTREKIEADTRKMYRQKAPKQQPTMHDEVRTPRRGSRSNFVALRRSIIESGRGNSKKPLSRAQKLARRRKR